MQARDLEALLSDLDPPVFRVERPDGASPFVLTCDHAGRVLPRALGSLGVSDAELGRHIAWDIGIAEVGRKLGERQPYAVSDETDYGVVVHGEQRGLMHVLLEIRQDLIDHEAGQDAWAERLARMLSAAHARLFGAPQR